MGHEIYSLGVCLLEIGLWRPLTQRQRDGGEAHFVSSPQLIELTKQELSSVPDHDKTLATYLRQRDGPKRLAQSLTTLAESELPFTMGTKYMRLVVDCLTCLDSDSKAWDVNFRKSDQNGILAAFLSRVLSILWGVGL